MDDIYEVRLEKLVYGGDAMGRLPDGRAVFVPFALPGEVVRLRVSEQKEHYARAELVEILEASAQRVTPRCAHFAYCGGCHYQHMDYDTQLEAKGVVLQEQLQRIAGLQHLPTVETCASPHEYYYRNHIQFHLTREGRLGFQKARSNQTFAIRECHLPEPAINQIWPLIEVEPVPGLERLSLRCGMADELMLILESSGTQPLDFSIEDLPISVVHQTPVGSLVLAGSDHIYIDVGGRSFLVSAGSFFQVNTLQAAAMVSHVMANLPLSDTTTVLDVYCGAGLFSAFLAPRVKSLVGIELSPETCNDFTTNLDEFDHVSLYEASAEDVLGSTRFNPDAILVDPPRQGLGAKAVEAIVAQGASNIAYVSCDPATLARDARRLAIGGYTLKKIALFDLFPQTYHIESISYWGKE
jgi:23S rRNA (uracil1939-C5)-methyltransferase